MEALKYAFRSGYLLRSVARVMYAMTKGVADMLGACTYMVPLKTRRRKFISNCIRSKSVRYSVGDRYRS